MKSDIAKAVQGQVFEFETLIKDLQEQKVSVSLTTTLKLSIFKYSKEKK